MSDRTSLVNAIPLIALLSGLLAAVACNQTPEQKIQDAREAVKQAAQQADWTRIKREQDTRGYARVGTTPTGEPLFMKEIRPDDYAWDRVYFTSDSITAHEYCGKNCQKSVTTNLK